MSLKSLLTRFVNAIAGESTPQPANQPEKTAAPQAQTVPFNDVAPAATPVPQAVKPSSGLALSLTITSDVGGTISMPSLKYNLTLLNYLFDAAEKGHEVIICTMGNLESVEDIIMMAERVLKRACPSSIRLMNKWQLKAEEIVPDIAFDDEDFRYLSEPPSIHGVLMDVEGTPSVPWAKLRRLAGLPDNEAAAPAPAP